MKNEQGSPKSPRAQRTGSTINRAIRGLSSLVPCASKQATSLNKIYTVGHSNHPIEKFLDLLTRNEITAIADVRSKPFSRRNPQFNKDRLAAALAQRDIAYVFLGRELGARSEDSACYQGGQVRYAGVGA